MLPFSFSRKEFDSYIRCLSNLKPGDIVSAQYSGNVIVEGLFLHKEIGYFREHKSLIVLIASNDDIRFHPPSYQEKQQYLVPAKKICPKILISKTNIFWVQPSTQIIKIIKYDAKKEKEEKSKKSKEAKSIRSRRQNA